MSEKGMLVFNKYKYLVFAILIIIVIIILDIIFENYAKKSIDKIGQNLEKMNDIFETQEIYDKKILNKRADAILNEWKDKMDNLSCFIEHDEVEKIYIKLKVLKDEIRYENWLDAKNTLAETRQILEFLDVKYNFSFQNLF